MRRNLEIFRNVIINKIFDDLVYVGGGPWLALTNPDRHGPRAKSSLFVLGGQEGLRFDSIVEFSTDSENASLTKI